jgi:VWFA-related protein
VIGVTAAGAAQQPTFRTSVSSISVDVFVRQNGKPVTNLTVADFEVRDNGVVQQILDVTREAHPVDVTMVIDLSGSVDGPLLTSLSRAVAATRQYYSNQDRVRVLTFNHQIALVRPFAPPGPDLGLASVPLAAGMTSVHDAIAVALAARPQPGRRQMAVVFTDGRDTSSFLDEASVLDLAARTEMAIFVVGMSNGTLRFPERLAQEGFFYQLSEATGGRLATLQRDEGLDEVFARAVDEFRTSYVLRYTPVEPVRDGFHELQVRITRAGRYDVRARRGYMARTSENCC